MPENRPQVDEVFDEALRRAAGPDRARYLDKACGADLELRRRVELLLTAASEAGSFLEAPAAPEMIGDHAGEAFAGATHAETCSNGEDVALDFLTPSQKSASLGRLGHYDILGVIGKGGMGIVLRAFDEKLHRIVAIKVMAAQLASNGTARQRFTREAQAAAAVSHDHIVTIHAVEEAVDHPYLVMQYVSGVSLQERLDRSGSLQLAEIVRIGMQTASALAAAHAQGVVHRDIKPANILLENGIQRVKVTDFGLARAGNDASLTQSGVVAGTPQFMSPEQARGEVVDQRTDLFSLGSVLYAMCTGRAPFRASGTMAVLKRVCEETPGPIRESNPDIPEWLVAIIDKLHAKDPAGRYQTAAEVAEVLNQHLAHLQHPSIVPLPATKPVQRPATWRRSRVAAVLLLCLIVGGVGLGLYLQRGQEEPSPGKGGDKTGAASPDAKTHLDASDALLWMTFEKDTFYSKFDATYVRDLSDHGRDGLCEKCEFTSGGRTGGALRLKGGALKVPHRLLNKQAEYTVAAWIFYDDLPGSGFSLMEEFWLEGGPNFTLSLFPTHLFANAWHSGYPSNWKGSRASLRASPGQWNFVAARLKNGGLDQGELLVTVNDKTVTVPSQMQDGRAAGHSLFGQMVEGKLDELLVLPRALGDDELRLLYQLGKEGRRPVLTPAVKAPPAAVAAKPVLLMHFDKADFYEKDGKTYVRDRSGNGNDGLCEQVRFTPEGKTGGGLANAGTGFLRLPFSLITGKSDFTIAGWAKITDLKKTWGLYAVAGADCRAGDPIVATLRFGVWRMPDACLSANAWNSALENPWIHARSGTLKVSPGEWLFVAAALEEGGPGKGRLRLMLNDQIWERPSQQIGGGLEGIQDIAATSLVGVFDELAVWRRALSDRELRDLFALGHAPAGKAATGDR